MGIFPDEMKTAKVTPHLQVGRKDCGHFSSIGLYLLYISAVAKILEKLVYDQINNFLAQTKVFSPHQSGFRAGHSTETSLLHTTNQCLGPVV